MCNVQHFQDTHCSVLNLNRFLDIIPKNGGPVSWLKDHAILIPTVRIFQPVAQIPLKKNKRSLVSQRLGRQVLQITIYLAGGSLSSESMQLQSLTITKKFFEVILNNPDQWLLETNRTYHKKLHL